MNDDLARELILDHARAPRNYRVLAEATASAEGHNPMCGDRVRVMVAMAAGLIKDIAIQGSGCSISLASASLMTEAVMGRTAGEAYDLLQAFRALVTAPADEAMPMPMPERLGKLSALAGVRRYPIRVKCAMLAWRTLEAALREEKMTVTTE